MLIASRVFRHQLGLVSALCRDLIPSGLPWDQMAALTGSSTAKALHSGVNVRISAPCVQLQRNTRSVWSRAGAVTGLMRVVCVQGSAAPATACARKLDLHTRHGHESHTAGVRAPLPMGRCCKPPCRAVCLCAPYCRLQADRASPRLSPTRL